MTIQQLVRVTGISAAILLLAGCATQAFDYTNFREHPPRSILVLPPLNETPAVEGTYSYLSTVTRPLAEQGYYVFPVAVVDQFFKENGMPTAGEMHQVPPKKIGEIMGADAVMYVTLKEYGAKYQIISSVPTVSASAKLVDTKTEILLWSGTVFLQKSSQGSGNILVDIVAAAVTQAISTSTDSAHALCGPANVMLFATKDYGLLYGPYHASEAGNAK